MTPNFFLSIENLLQITSFLILAIVLTLFLLLSPFILLPIFRLLTRGKKSQRLVFYLVRVPKANEVKIDAAEQMFASLYAIHRYGLDSLIKGQDTLGFEIVALKEDIRFYVVCPDHLANFVEKQLHSAYSEAQIDRVRPWNIWKSEGYVSFVSLRLRGPSYYPIRRYKDLPTDPLNIITSSLSKLDEGEGVAMQILIKPAGNDWQIAGKQFIDKINNRNSDPNKRPIPIDPEFLKGVSEKCSKIGFEVSLRLVSVGKDKVSSLTNLNNMVGAFEQFTDPTFNRFKRDLNIFKRLFVKSFIHRYFPLFSFSFLQMPFYTGTSILNTEELATIFHLPNKEVTTPHINWLLARKYAAPVETPTQGLYLGESIFRGAKKEIYILPDDRRRHMYIVGQTGTGKSEFLKFMAIQDIKNGHGVAFIDPHGAALEDILEQMPEERIEDVIYFDPADIERPMGLNILEAKTEQQKHMLINSFIALLYKLYDPDRKGIMGPRLERAVRNVMLTAMEEEGNSLVEVLRLLTDPEFAKSKLPLIKDPLVKRYWTDELARTSSFHKSEVLGYFVSKFDRFVTEKTMRNIIGQSHSSFNFREVMDQQKILLIDLAKGKLGEENSIFLGLILVPRILVAAMSRVDVREEERKDFYLYVDEFQNFSTPDFAQILSEARKYHLNLTVANQFIAQIMPEIREAVFGNIGTLIAFRVGIDDATYLEHHFEPTFTKNDLINNPTGQVYIKLLVRGAPTMPFSMSTDWEMMVKAERSERTAQIIKQLSRLRFGKDRVLVEAEVARRAKL